MPQTVTPIVPPVSRPLIAIVLLGVAVTACQSTTVTSSSSVVDASPSAKASSVGSQEPAPTVVRSTSAEPTAQPSALIRPDTVVATIVEGLSVRRSPGTEGQLMGHLELGTTAFVLAGPTDVDGVPWYSVTGMGLPYLSGCMTMPPDQPITCPAFQGWVAGANEAADPWLEPTDPGACPEPTIRGISEAGFTWRLVCWADQPITFDAWWPEIPEGAGLGGICLNQDEPGGFLFCQHVNYNGLTASPDEGFAARLSLSIDPASGVTMPARGQSVRVTGRFDHAAADECAAFAGPNDDPLAVVFTCRLQFVPTSVEALGS